jgi:chromosome segregation ATPase
MLFFALFFASCWSSAGAYGLRQKENPIRRIVTLLQDMQKEIETEGEKEEKAFDKFMCYCDGNSDGMKKAAEEGAQKATELASKLEALQAEKAQLEQELKDHQSSRETAKQDQDKATSIREKEKADFDAASADMSTNIAAMKGAIAALEKGLGAFMQISSSQKAVLQRIVAASSTLDDYQREGAMAFVQGKESAQSSGEIMGMLKAMLEEMEGDLATAEKDEATAVAGFEELSAAKAAEIASATSAIESKTKRAGEVAVEVVQTKDDLEDTKAEVSETTAFLGDLGKQCAEKKSEWAERQKMRAEEVSAISEAIKVLNDDDALDLFKKTVPSMVQTGMQFLQRGSPKSSMALRAKTVLVSLMQKSQAHATVFSLLSSALKSKSVDFSKITAQIDGMIDVLGKEQADDDKQKAFCDSEFSKSAAEKKATEEKLASLAASIEEMSATVATLTSEIETLSAEIKALDKAVAEATEQRKEEHATFLQAQAENQAATQLVEAAKNKLYKFYNPVMYKAPERRELTEEERIAVSGGAPDPRDAEEATAAPGIAGTGIAVFAQVRSASNAAPPPPPETFGAYTKKTGKSNGVIALMDMMISDLKTDLTDSEHAEEMAQKDYENLMSASQKSRATNAESITEKESASAEWSEKIENSKTEQASTTEALMKLKEYIAGLHSSCDFLVENYESRKEARTNEVEGLKNAKSVLAGANFS